MEPRDIIVLTPPGDLDPSLAIAACRAGAAGVLDLEFCTEPSVATAVLARLARFARGGFGVQLRADAAEILAAVLAQPVRPARVILTGGDHPELPTRIGELKAGGIEVLFEATGLR